MTPPIHPSTVAPALVPLQSGLTGQLVSVLVNGLIFGSIFALTAVGLTLVFGILDVPNFAQGEFASFAGYGTIVLATATGVADLLAQAGVPFRTAHEVVATAADDATSKASAANCAVRMLMTYYLSRLSRPLTKSFSASPVPKR